MAKIKGIAELMHSGKSLIKITSSIAVKLKVQLQGQLEIFFAVNGQATISL